MLAGSTSVVLRCSVEAFRTTKFHRIPIYQKSWAASRKFLNLLLSRSRTTISEWGLGVRTIDQSPAKGEPSGLGRDPIREHHARFESAYALPVQVGSNCDLRNVDFGR